MKKLLYFITAGLTVFLLNTGRIFAQSSCEQGNAEDCLTQGNPGKILDIIGIGLNFLAGFVFLAAVIMLIMGGIQYITSNGNPKAVEEAKSKIRNVLIGLAAFIFLYAFLQWLIPGAGFIL